MASVTASSAPVAQWIERSPPEREAALHLGKRPIRALLAPHRMRRGYWGLDRAWWLLQPPPGPAVSRSGDGIGKPSGKVKLQPVRADVVRLLKDRPVQPFSVRAPLPAPDGGRVERLPTQPPHLAVTASRTLARPSGARAPRLRSTRRGAARARHVPAPPEVVDVQRECATRETAMPLPARASLPTPKTNRQDRVRIMRTSSRPAAYANRTPQVRRSEPPGDTNVCFRVRRERQREARRRAGNEPRRDTGRVMSEESTTPDPVELLRRAFEAANRGDLDAVASSFAEDATFDGRGVPDHHEGRAAIRSMIEEWFGSYEELEFGLEEVRDLGNGVVFAVVVQSGRLTGSAGHVRQREGWVFVWARGLVARLTTSTRSTRPVLPPNASQRNGGRRCRKNIDLVRSIYAAWERGDFSDGRVGDPEIEFVIADGAGTGHGWAAGSRGGPRLPESLGGLPASCRRVP